MEPIKTNGQIRIAIADDHTLVREGIVSLLNTNNKLAVTISANNGQELLDMLEAAEQLPDICLLDISMPVLNGFDTVVEIKNRWPGIKVLALSVYDSTFTILRMLRLGACGYIVKDGQANELFEAIEKATETGFYHSGLCLSALQLVLKDKMNGRKNNMLTAREIQLLKYCCSELTYKEIANEMKIGHRTVEGYIEELFEKLKVRSRVGLVMCAMYLGIMPAKAT